MTKIIAYIRTSTDKQELNNQKLAILVSFLKVEFSELSKSSSVI